MTELTIFAYAKVNLFLSVRERRADGYHELDTVFQSISLCDTLTLSRQGTGIVLACDDPTLPTGEKNLAYRAAQAFFAAYGQSFGVKIALQKRIPSQAGLGGGSADAAAVLLGLNQLCGEPFDRASLAALGATLGADVPFCVRGGAQHARGFGQELTPCAPLPDCSVLCVMGKEGISTGEAFAALDRDGLATEPSSTAMLEALTRGDYRSVCENLYNSFERVTPAAPTLVARLCALGADGARLSGSGAAVFALFSDAVAARAAQASLCADGYRADLCHPISSY